MRQSWATSVLLAFGATLVLFSSCGDGWYFQEGSRYEQGLGQITRMEGFGPESMPWDSGGEDSSYDTLQLVGTAIVFSGLGVAVLALVLLILTLHARGKLKPTPKTSPRVLLVLTAAHALRLGWADGNLFEYLTATAGVSREAALKTGLFVVLRGGRVTDFFRYRLVFPYWRGWSAVYFIARATQYTGDEAWEQPKYKKLLTHSERHDYVSPTVRNDFFYNEDAARGADELLITEGVTDCISAMQAGVACISPVTTTFRKRDIPRLVEITRRTGRVVICNDSETSGAGEAGAKETAAALWAEGREACIATIPRPEGKDKIDVNELVASQGPEALCHRNRGGTALLGSPTGTSFGGSGFRSPSRSASSALRLCRPRTSGRPFSVPGLSTSTRVVRFAAPNSPAPSSPKSKSSLAKNCSHVTTWSALALS